MHRAIMPFLSVPLVLGSLLVTAGPGVASAEVLTDVAFTRTSPSFPNMAVDGLEVGNPGNFAEVPLPASIEFPADVDIFNDRLYVVGTGSLGGSTGELWSMDLDGSNATQHASGLDGPQFLDLSPDGSTIYFSQTGTGDGGTFGDNGRISRVDVGTGTVTDIVTAPIDAGATGLDFDPDSNSIFYQVNNRGDDNTVQQIRRVDASLVNAAAGSDELWLENPVPADGTLDTGDEFTVTSAGRNVQVHGGYVYWTYRNGTFTPASEIRRLPVDFDITSDDPEAFETVVTGTRITDFEIFGDELLWTDVDVNQVNRANLDGSGQTLVAQGPSFESLPIGVGVQAIPAPAPVFAGLALLGVGWMRGRSRRRG